MRKHEACHWINEMAIVLRDRAKYAKVQIAEVDCKHPDYRQELDEIEHKLTALDMAGDALTRSR